jgi:type IV secretion system protein VirB9
MRARSFIAMMLVPMAAAALAAQAPGVREVSASGRGLISVNTKLRYTTMIFLPTDDEIVDVVCGDKDFWVISAALNVAHVKPAKEGAATNLNLVTARGTVYSFLLTEDKKTPPDLKVYVDADKTPAGEPRYYSASQVNALRNDLTEARAAVEAAQRRITEATDAAQRRIDEAIATFKQHYPATLAFPYGLPKYQKPFYVRSIWHDGQFTYIKSDARELPALYELNDDQPSLVNFQVDNGTFVVPKVLDRGYLALGNQRFAFAQGK